MTYSLVYDVTTAGPSTFSIILLVLALIITIFGWVRFKYPDLLTFETPRQPPANDDGKARWGLLAAGSAILFFAFAMTDGGRSDMASAARRGDCNTVEGAVSDYRLTHGERGYRGYAESFSVSDIEFIYADGESTGGFNNTAHHNGPIDGDLAVRICYHASEKLQRNIILKLEVAN